jgi:2-phosphoglycolate phosphatase
MFDLDGTLADTGLDLADAVNFTRAYFNLPPLAERLICDHVGRGVEHLLQHSVPEQNPARFDEVMRVFLQRYESHLLDRTVLYPGAREALKHFRGKRRAVVSNKIHRLTVAMLRGLGVEEEFDIILGGDSAVEKKPHPALLNAVLRHFEVPAPGAVMVGDGDTDVEAGKRAGVITCGVTFGLGAKDELIAAGPDLLIDDLRQLAENFC